MHPDEFDGVVRYGKWLAMLGSRNYDLTVVANRRLNFLRRRLAMPCWSLSPFLKGRVKEAVKVISTAPWSLSTGQRPALVTVVHQLNI